MSENRTPDTAPEMTEQQLSELSYAITSFSKFKSAVRECYGKDETECIINLLRSKLEYDSINHIDQPINMA